MNPELGTHVANISPQLVPVAGLIVPFKPTRSYFDMRLLQ